ncbi:MAG TPA: pantoate--beta-alanine ligase, partial [Thermomicrobiales bacterium]|nr:pantoate--beta-alanine ligase [Thermomicrobiales bacterium]
AREGIRDAARLEAAGRAALARTPELDLDYLAVVNGATLEPATTVEPGSRALAAVEVGGVRLIDNVALPTGDAP